MKLLILFFLLSCQIENKKIVFEESELKGCDEVHLFAPLRCLPESKFEGCTESLLKVVEKMGASTLLINQTKENFKADEFLGRAFNCPK